MDRIGNNLAWLREAKHSIDRVVENHKERPHRLSSHTNACCYSPQVSPGTMKTMGPCQLMVDACGVDGITSKVTGLPWWTHLVDGTLFLGSYSLTLDRIPDILDFTSWILIQEITLVSCPSI